MRPPLKKPYSDYRATDGGGGGSNNLWVGNLGGEVTESELRVLFGKFGSVDSITCYPSRSYAFICFKRPDEAQLAKDSLQSTLLHANSLKIEFAKPAKPCKSLWVSGISSAVSKEQLEEEFTRFGKIEDFKFLRDRNTAYVDYMKLEDASEALKGMNGKRIGGTHIRVDYLRSHSRRDHLPESREAREGHFVSRSMGPHDSLLKPQDSLLNYSEPAHHGFKRQQHSLSSAGDQNIDGELSNVLKISYPPSVHVDEQMLHNAMILFGEIERIKSFASRQYYLVEFRSTEEAQRAKQGLQGKLFNDPRISIIFFSIDLASDKDFSGFNPGIKGPRPEVFFNKVPFQHAHMVDVYGQIRPPPAAAGNILHGPRAAGPVLPIMRPLAPPNSFETLLPDSNLNDSALRDNKLPDTNPIPLNWTRPIISSPWDIFDGSHLQREPKRSRIDGHPLSLLEMNDRFLGPVRVSPQVDEGALVSFRHVQRNNSYRFTTGDQPDLDYIWRGVIAKGGSPVCRARCVPLGEWIGYEIPEVVNCSARTGLDMLVKHYADAVGFNIVFFLPDSEEDFSSYTEFLRYLGDKNRAGVAKCDDGTTLFLVPPSDFLTRVLNVTGPERLYGLVLKFPHSTTTTSSVHPPPQSEVVVGQPPFIDKLLPIPPPRNEYGVMPPKEEERVIQIDYYNTSSRVSPQEDLRPPPRTLKKPGLPTSTSSSPHHPGGYSITSSSSTHPPPPGGLSLTPELIATLATLIRPKESNSLLQPASSTAASDYDRAPPPQQKSFFNYDERQTGRHSYNIPQQQPQSLPISNSANDFDNSVVVSNQSQDHTFSFPGQGAMSSINHPQSGRHLTVPLHGSQQYRPESPQSGYGTMVHRRTEPYGGEFTSSMILPPSSSSQVHSSNVYQPQTAFYYGEEGQEGTSGGGGGGVVDADKNERYRSTLQFAANLLQQIHQKQPDTRARQGGDGNQ